MYKDTHNVISNYLSMHYKKARKNRKIAAKDLLVEKNALSLPLFYQNIQQTSLLKKHAMTLNEEICFTYFTPDYPVRTDIR